MDLLRSSILGQEFINYRKTSYRSDRRRFSTSIRNLGVGQIPIVIDSIDLDISKKLAQSSVETTFYKKFSYMYNPYGRSFIYHMDNNISNIVFDLKKILEETDIRIGLEDGTFPSFDTDLGTLYKKYRNPDDKILYLLVTKETSIFGYIMSIVNYIKDNVLRFIQN